MMYRIYNSPMSYFIEFIDVSKSFGDVTVLDGVSFGVNEGETFGILGPSGAGKTVTRATLPECRPTPSMLTDLRMVFWRMTVPEISNGGATRHHGRMCLVLKGSNELEVGPGGVDDTGLWTRCLGCETSHVHDDTDLVTAR